MKFFGFLFLLALIAAAAAGYVIYTPFGPQAETFVDIVPGTGTQAIAQQLESNGVIRHRYGFDLLRKFRGGRLKAGEYRFDHPVPMTEVYDRIVRGDVYTRAFTIPEGYNIFDIAKAVEDRRFRLPRCLPRRRTAAHRADCRMDAAGSSAARLP